MKPSNGEVFLGLAVAVSVFAVIAGVVVAGTPVEGRMQRLDKMRSDDLRAIMVSIDGYWRRHGQLPGSLSDLAGDPRAQVSTRDPGDGGEYEYRILGDDSYELCAVFGLASIPNHRAPEAFWLHDAGRYCFSLSANATR